MMAGARQKRKRNNFCRMPVCMRYYTYDTRKPGRNICQKNTKTKPGRAKKTGVFQVLDWKKKSAGS